MQSYQQGRSQTVLTGIEHHSFTDKYVALEAYLEKVYSFVYTKKV